MVSVTDEQICKANDRLIEYGRLKRVARASSDAAFLRENFAVSAGWGVACDIYHEAEVAIVLVLRDLGIEVATSNSDPRVCSLVSEEKQ